MKTIHTTSKCLRNIGTAIGMTLVALTMWFGAGYTANADSLYIGDYYDNTVKQFDAGTGDFQGKFVKSQGGCIFQTASFSIRRETCCWPTRTAIREPAVKFCNIAAPASC